MTGNDELDKPTRGQYVMVFGLQSQTGRLLNGQKGIVIKASDAAGRTEVCLGPEGKVTSLKPENVRLATGATAEEIEDAKDIAGPALRAAHPDQAQPEQCSTSTATPHQVERERSRSWSPPPDVVRAAAAAAGVASSSAVMQGLSSEQAEARGAAAAEQSLARARQAAYFQRHKAAKASSVSAEVAAVDKKPSSVEHLKAGDTVQLTGLKSDDNGKKCVIKELQGWGIAQRYVVTINTLIINGQGDLEEQKRLLTLHAKNICLPGEAVVEGAVAAEEVSPSDGSRVRKSIFSGGADKQSMKKKSKRSRSRRRRRRSTSSTSSSSSRAPPPTCSATEDSRNFLRDKTSSAAAQKAERLRKFGFA